MSALNRPRWEQFCQFVATGMPQTAAYMCAAGNTNERSSGKSAVRPLKNERICARIRELQGERREIEQRQTIDAANRHRVTKEFVLTGLREIHERCMVAMPVLDRKGKPTGQYRFDSSGANRALELMGKHLGMFVEKVELGRPSEFERLSKLTDEQLAEELIEEMAQAQNLIEQLKRPTNDNSSAS
jgi:phage terminase small subunit